MGTAHICGTCLAFDALDKPHKPHLLDVFDVTQKPLLLQGIFIRSGVTETRALGGFFRFLLDSRVLRELLPLGAVEDLQSGCFVHLLIAEKRINKRHGVNTRCLR